VLIKIEATRTLVVTFIQVRPFGAARQLTAAVLPLTRRAEPDPDRPNAGRAFEWLQSLRPLLDVLLLFVCFFVIFSVRVAPPRAA
jgi:hypothetical protein